MTNTREWLSERIENKGVGGKMTSMRQELGEVLCSFCPERNSTDFCEEDGVRDCVAVQEGIDRILGLGYRKVPSEREIVVKLLRLTTSGIIHCSTIAEPLRQWLLEVK